MEEALGEGVVVAVALPGHRLVHWNSPKILDTFLKCSITITQGEKVEKKPNRRYTKEFKAEAVELAGRVGTKKAADDLGIDSKNIRNWKKRAPGSQKTPVGKRPYKFESGSIAGFYRQPPSYIHHIIMH